MSQKYIVAYISFFDNKVRLAATKADSRFEAGKKYMEGMMEGSFPSDIDTMDELKDLCFDCDGSIEVKALDDLV